MSSELKTTTPNRISPIFLGNPTQVGAEIERLHTLYRSLYRKNLSVNLSLAIWGEKRNTQYGISLMWNTEDLKEAEWVVENVVDCGLELREGSGVGSRGATRDGGVLDDLMLAKITSKTS